MTPPEQVVGHQTLEDRNKTCEALSSLPFWAKSMGTNQLNTSALGTRKVLSLLYGQLTMSSWKPDFGVRVGKNTEYKQ